MERVSVLDHEHIIMRGMEMIDVMNVESSMEHRARLTRVMRSEYSPNAAMSLIWVESCGERLISSDRHSKVCILRAIFEKDLELFPGCCL